MNCERYGCQNTKCNRYSSEYGYICDSCFDQLVASGIGRNIKSFMESEPRPLGFEASRLYFDNIFAVKS